MPTGAGWKRLGLAVAAALVLVVVSSVPQVALGASSTPGLQVTPNAGPVGSTLTISGAGFPPSTVLTLKWSTVNASWVVSGNPPQVTGTRVVNTFQSLGTVTTDAGGSFTASITAPPDYGSPHHDIQAFAPNGTAFSAKVLFTLEPSFHLSSTSGVAGSPITVTATGLGYGLYSTSYHVYWDNGYVGYATALLSRGSTNFTIYASGEPGVHFIDIYQGYPGPGYLNPQEGPPSGETQSTFPPLIPFHANFTVTSSGSSAGPSSLGPFPVIGLGGVLVVLALAMLVALREPPDRRRALLKALAAVTLIVAVVVGGVGGYLYFGGQQPSPPSYTEQSSVVRPLIDVPQNTATSGPRMSVTPDLVTVGEAVTVTGSGFSPNAALPISWSTREGNNLFGYQLVSRPLRNVTAQADGTFSFTMTVPYDLGGIHYISAANLTRASNATLYLQRSASISATQGPSGTPIVVKLTGVGWDYNTNIVAVDYDNSYFGYACGFSSGGNVTVTVYASGAPGVHTIDIYPSVWWGTSVPTAQLSVEYRYPLLTPMDHPELMPSFHFTFLVT